MCIIDVGTLITYKNYPIGPIINKHNIYADKDSAL